MANVEDLIKHLNYSAYEYKFSLHILDKLDEKKQELSKVIEEIDNILVSTRETIEADLDFSLNEIMTEKKANLHLLTNMQAEKIDDEAGIIEFGAQVVKRIGKQSTLFTQLQLLITKGSFEENVTVEQVTTLKYLIDYGRQLLLEMMS
ncbi:hypothetical protein N0O92_11690 [Alkalihalobacillus sp. MEB130]|uniref:hypothetical protein n=1 Tax=Alkalihalobacillus sp. MEB130 TaxID=2976704 RepID=UPI0028DF0D79|nr:hypothetical protein [Alkalihalobacillus sp. MEB130]MDT8860893.1 hypothetical protein [Alkalihalobacillus sp. MEB130]